MPVYRVDLPTETTHERIADALELINAETGYLNVAVKGAKQHATSASQSASIARNAATNAKASETNAEASAHQAGVSATNAAASATTATQKANAASRDANRAEAAVSSANGIYENVVTATENFDSNAALARSGIDTVYASSRDALTSQTNTAISSVGNAKNLAVSEVNAAIQKYPKIVGGNWYVWDVTQGDFVDTGVPATGSGGGSGEGSGQDGFSPIVSKTTITGGTRLSIQDKTHTETIDILNGTNGDNGVSPVVSISAITGGHAITITDALHPNGQTFNVMNGNDYVLTAQDKSDIAALVVGLLPTYNGQVVSNNG